MGILSWLILGALAGWLAGKIMKTDSSGTLGNVVLGIIGALLGGFIMNNLFNRAGAYGLNFYSLGVAVLGAIVLIALARLFKRI